MRMMLSRIYGGTSCVPNVQRGCARGLNLFNVGSTANPFVHISIFGVNGLLYRED
jgi:hypothetical protein